MTRRPPRSCGRSASTSRRQLGALFVGDASYLEDLTRDALPVVDDQPARLRLAAADPPADALVEAWRDEDAAARRFQESPWVARLWPTELRKRTLSYFHWQRLDNDLLFDRPGPGFSKDLGTVASVLAATDLRLPVLLLLGSDPDLQRALAASSTLAQRSDPDVLRHRAIGLLAERDFPAAADALECALEVSLRGDGQEASRRHRLRRGGASGPRGAAGRGARRLTRPTRPIKPSGSIEWKRLGARLKEMDG